MKENYPNMHLREGERYVAFVTQTHVGERLKTKLNNNNNRIKKLMKRALKIESLSLYITQKQEEKKFLKKRTKKKSKDKKIPRFLEMIQAAAGVICSATTSREIQCSSKDKQIRGALNAHFKCVYPKRQQPETIKMLIW